MENKNIRLQVRVLFDLILVNFIAQVPYFFHLYYGSQSWLINLRSFVILGSVFAFFLVGSILLFKRRRSGYWLMVIFLSVEFLFYFWGAILSALRGLGFFPQIYNPDLWLRIIYSIGYMNLFASGYFLFLLIFRKANFLTVSNQSQPVP
jgi:hypothetical protein